MNTPIVALCLLISSVAAQVSPNNSGLEATTTAAPGSFFKLPFNLPSLTFNPGTPCFGASEVGRTGICRTLADCGQTGGYPDGQCALLPGQSCCMSVIKCGETVTTNNSFIANPEIPKYQTKGQQCTVTINKLLNVKKVRLEMSIFELNPPSADGKCVADKFWVEGPVTMVKIPMLCGVNTKQHLILPINETSTSFRIRVDTTGDGNRKWLIKIVQLEQLPGPQWIAVNPLPPSGCRQLMTGPQGEIMNFNYDLITHQSTGTIDGLKYAICFKKQAGFCGIRFDADYFKLSPKVSRRRRCTTSGPNADCATVPIAVYQRLLNSDPELKSWARTSTVSPGNETSNVTSTDSDVEASNETSNETTVAPQAPGYLPHTPAGQGQEGCWRKDSISFPPSESGSGPTTFCTDNFGDNGNFTGIGEPFVVYVDSGAEHGRGFHMNYTYLKC